MLVNNGIQQGAGSLQGRTEERDVHGSRLSTYPAYRRSGAEWLGDVPEHWDVRRLGTTASILNGATPSTSVPSYWEGEILWVTPEDLGRLRSRYVKASSRRITQDGYDASGTTQAPAGSVALSTRAPIGHLGILAEPGCVNQGCRLLTPLSELQSEFLHYSLTACREHLAALGQGSTFTELSRTPLANFRIPLPPLPEQAAIVRYLDYVDRRIRRYVAAKRRLIALLEEEKQAIVNRAVTRGLDPNVHLKPSSVEWLGDVPEHWARKRLKTILQSIDRRSTTGSETLLSLRRDHGVVIYAEHFKRPSQSRSLVGFKLINVGQLVVNRLQANNGLIFNSTVEGLVSPDYSVFERRSPLSMNFLSDLLRTSSYRVYFRQNAKGLGTGTAGFLRLYDDAFLETPVNLPPVTEQRAIVEHLDKAIGDRDTAIVRARRQIELVQEYRTRLIADVVTGKLDVREAAAHLPKEAEDDEPIDEDGLVLDNEDEWPFDVDGAQEEELAAESEVGE